jgi:thaumarchaeosortase
MWTWKGRMFYLLFLWILFIEFVIDWNIISENKPKTTPRILASLVCALVPTFYILAINFLGLNQVILNIGQYFGIGTGDFLYFHWPLSCEYLIFAIFFTGAIALAYKKEGLKTFAISLAFLGGISIAYMLDTIYPFGVFKPLQEFTLPTAATTAALFDFLGYTTNLNYPIHYGGSLLPYLSVSIGGKSASVAIAWACAGVHSLLLYVLIIAVFFKKSSISAFRKLSYFVIGLFGTFFVNVLRVFSIVVIMLNYGYDAGMTFHNTYGEIYFFTWIFLFILLIVCIQRFMLVERTRQAFQRLGSFFGTAKNKLLSRLKKQ